MSYFPSAARTLPDNTSSPLSAHAKHEKAALVQSFGDSFVAMAIFRDKNAATTCPRGALLELANDFLVGAGAALRKSAIVVVERF